MLFIKHAGVRKSTTATRRIRSRIEVKSVPQEVSRYLQENGQLPTNSVTLAQRHIHSYKSHFMCSSGLVRFFGFLFSK